MKYGDPTTQLVTETNVSHSGAINLTSLLSNIANPNTLESWKAEDGGSGVTITVDLGGDQYVDLVAIANLTGVGGLGVTIRLNRLTVQQASSLATIEDPLQQTYAHAEFDYVLCDEIEIIFTASSEFEIGYVFAGQLSLAIDPQAFQVALESADPTSVARAGNPQTSITYLVHRVSVTTKKLTFGNLRQVFAIILTNGYGTPLFWLFDEDCIFDGEVLLAILDAPNVSISTEYEAQGGNLAQTTIGILEVY